MSRIGKMPIEVPAGITVEFERGVVSVKGPKGELTQEIADRHIEIVKEGAALHVNRNSENKETRAKHGLYRQLISNMVKGVTNPFVKTLIVHGVGWKCSVTGNRLVMNIGFSHQVEIFAPDGITIACTDPTTITVTGIDRQLVGQVAATIKSKRPVEPYHAYGIRYKDEVVIRKEGKTGKK
ncbi:MAG: 50S ribosomal protein L6 [Firmicutes bacterium]|nr:50S ribosomal protein L6 [Bacillota bacterium]